MYGERRVVGRVLPEQAGFAVAYAVDHADRLPDLRERVPQHEVTELVGEETT